MPMYDIEVEEMSVFSRLAAQDSENGHHHPETTKANGKRRKAEAVPVPTEESGESDVFE